MDSLPAEILLHILTYLPSEGDVQHCRHVNKRLHGVVCCNSTWLARPKFVLDARITEQCRGDGESELQMKVVLRRRRDSTRGEQAKRAMEEEFDLVSAWLLFGWCLWLVGFLIKISKTHPLPIDRAASRHASHSR